MPSKKWMAEKSPRSEIDHVSTSNLRHFVKKKKNVLTCPNRLCSCPADISALCSAVIGMQDASVRATTGHHTAAGQPAALGRGGVGRGSSATTDTSPTDSHGERKCAGLWPLLSPPLPSPPLPSPTWCAITSPLAYTTGCGSGSGSSGSSGSACTCVD